MLLTRKSSVQMMCLISWTLLATFLSTPEGVASTQQGVHEYCQDENMEASCGENEAILMTLARYGRMNVGGCAMRSLGFIGCAANALQLVHSRCSGRRQCQLSIMDPELRALEPCPEDVTWYLEASYTCVPVTTRPQHECRSRSSLRIQESSGYLSSELAMTSSVGSPSCPWEILAPPGQRINVTLYNFVYQSHADGVPGTGPCVTVATLVDPTPAPRKQVHAEACASQTHGLYTYVSRANRLEVIFPAARAPAPPSESRTQFLLKYQFLGCPDLVPQEGATVTRDKDTVQVKCSLTEETWYLTCEGTHWTGMLGNCSRTTAHHSWDIDDIFQSDETFPFGILLVVAVGVALGIFLGGTLLLVVSVYMKRRHNRQHAQAAQHDTAAFQDTVLPEEYYRKQELTELNYSEESFSPAHGGHGGRQTSDTEYKITEYRPSYTHVSYSSTANAAPKNAPHVYESPTFS